MKKKKSKYLIFESTSYGRVLVFNKKEFLGFIEYYPKWKQYIFEPALNTIYSFECLQDIIDKIKECNILNNEKKE